MRWPGGSLKQGKNISALTAHVDIVPTLIDLCQLEISEQIDFDGQSMVPLIYDNSQAWKKDRIYVTQFTQPLPGKYHNSPPKNGRTVVSKEKWRLVNDELYNIAADASQKNNIAKEYPHIVQEMSDNFEDYWRDIFPFTQRIARVQIGNAKQLITTLSLAGVTPPQGHSGQWSIAGAVEAEEINGKFPLFVEESGVY